MRKFIALSIFGALLAMIYGICGPPKELPDRLAVIRESQVNINNEIYNTHADTWHSEGETLNLIYIVNPARLHYFHELLKLHASDPLILDVGSGGGVLTNEIASLGYRIRGIDIAENSIEAARQNAKKRGLETVQFSYGSAYEIPYPDDSFEVVLISDVLEHLLDLRKAFSEIKRVLKPNGLLLFDTINRTQFSYWITIFAAERFFRLFGEVDHLHDWPLYITPDEVAQVLTEEGFSFHQEDWRGMRPTFSLAGLFSQGLMPGFIQDFELTTNLWGNYAGFANL